MVGQESGRRRDRMANNPRGSTASMQSLKSFVMLISFTEIVRSWQRNETCGHALKHLSYMDLCIYVLFHIITYYCTV